MRFHQTDHHRFFNPFRSLAQALLAALTLTALSAQALAQGPPPNLTFGDSNYARYRSSGNVAFKGFLSADVDGRIKDGEALNLHVAVNPDTNGPKGFRLFQINYRKSPSALAPTARWYNLANGKKLVISGVRASEYFSGTSVVSSGKATVEITFVNGGAGQMVIRYQHETYNHPPSDPSLRYNGAVCGATPLAGHRLYFILN